MKVFRFMGVSLLLLMSSMSASFGAILNVDNGTLLGASGVSVNGNLYDVSFQRGSCISLFNGCDEATDFFFTDVGSAAAANLALLNQVFTDTAEGLFDSNPSLTNGCDHSFTCSIQTPILLGMASGTVIASFLRNSAQENLDTHTGVWSNIGIGADFGTSSYPLYSYALWSGSTSTSVPLPVTIWLFLLGLMGVVLINKNKVNNRGFLSSVN